MLPQTNCELIAVHGAGGSEDFDRAPGAGAAKWTGRSGAYLRQREERVTTGTASSIVITRSLIVEAGLPVDWSEGDVLTITGPAGTQTPIVRGIEPFTHPTAPGETRLVLENA